MQCQVFSCVHNKTVCSLEQSSNFENILLSPMYTSTYVVFSKLRCHFHRLKYMQWYSMNVIFDGEKLLLPALLPMHWKHSDVGSNLVMLVFQNMLSQFVSKLPKNICNLVQSFRYKLWQLICYYSKISNLSRKYAQHASYIDTAFNGLFNGSACPLYIPDVTGKYSQLVKINALSEIACYVGRAAICVDIITTISFRRNSC